MFTQNRCLVHYCRNNALSTFSEDGEITDERSYCLDHIPDPGKAKQDIYKYILSHDKIVGLKACGLVFENVDLTGKRFYGCNFMNCTFINIHSSEIVAKMCVYDFALFNDCSFVNGNCLFNTFSGITLSHTLFTSSDLIQNNFNGVKAFQSSFDDSDLYNSRFISASLIDTSFRNCNLKKVHFENTTRTNVSFKMSNTREAFFDDDGAISIEEKHPGTGLTSGGLL